MRQAILKLCSAFMIAASANMGASAAENVADFYRGKTVTMIIPSNVGGGYDLYGRFVARNMGKHIPGAPTVIVKNMPGAGGIAAANHLYAMAPRDGLHLGIFQNTITLMQLTKSPVVKFDVREFEWLGNASAASSICALAGEFKDIPVKDLLTREIVLGASSGSVAMIPNLLNSLAGTKFKVVFGYPSTANVIMAMERGEANGLCGWSWDGARVNARDMLARGVAKVRLDIAIQPQQELAEMGVPFLMDYLPDDENKTVLRVLLSTQAYNRPFAAPPGVPADRLAALRASFEATLKAQETLEEADKLGLDVTYMPPERVQELIRLALDAPAHIQERAANELKKAGFGS